jgi:DinB family protein
MNPVDVMMYGQRTIDGLIDRLEPEDWSAIALGVWTTKDLVGHLGAFEVRFADVLALFTGDTPRTNLVAASPSTFNDDQAAIRRDWAVDRIVAELREAHALVMERARRIPPERWREVGTIPAYGPEYSLDEMLVYTMYGHKREHAPQLEAVLERTGA